MRLRLIAMLLVLLGGCTALNFQADPETLTYDLGPVPVPAAAEPYRIDGGLRLSEINAPAYLQGTSLQYRQLHLNPYRRNAYGYSQWTAPLPTLFQQRLFTLLAEQIDGGISPPLAARRDRYRLEVNLAEFIQEFASADEAWAVLRMQWQLIDRKLGVIVASRSVTRRAPCASADVSGGVTALVELANATLAEVPAWVRSELSAWPGEEAGGG